VLTTKPLPKGDRVAAADGFRAAPASGRGHGFDAGVCGCPNCRTSIQTEIKKTAAILWLRPRNPIDVTAQGASSGGLQRSIDLLDVSDEVDAILMVLSLSSEVRMPFKQVS